MNKRLDYVPYLYDQYSTFSERIRNLQAILSRQMGTGQKRLLTLSFWAGEGKSLLSMNLAVAIARSGNTVTLVDGDFRRPALSHFFSSEEDTPGFADLLLGEKSLTIDDCLCQIGSLETLRFCSAGSYEDNDIDALLQPELIEKQLEQFDSDWVLVDAPPLSVCADGLILSEACNGVVLISNERSFQGDPEARLLKQLEDHDAPIIGLVLNEVESSSEDSYYGYGYGHKAYYGEGRGGQRYYRSRNSEQLQESQDPGAYKSWWDKFLEVFQD